MWICHRCGKAGTPNRHICDEHDVEVYQRERQERIARALTRRHYIEIRLYYPDIMRDAIDAEALKDKLYDDFVGVGAPTPDQPFTDVTYVDSAEVPDAFLPHEDEEEGA